MRAVMRRLMWNGFAVVPSRLEPEPLVGTSTWVLRVAGWLGPLILVSGCTLEQDERDESPQSSPAASLAPSAPSTATLGIARAALVTSIPIDVVGDTYVRSGSPNQNAGGDTVLSLQSSGNRRSLLFFDNQPL